MSIDRWIECLRLSQLLGGNGCQGAKNAAYESPMGLPKSIGAFFFVVLCCKFTSLAFLGLLGFLGFLKRQLKIKFIATLLRAPKSWGASQVFLGELATC